MEPTTPTAATARPDVPRDGPAARRAGTGDTSQPAFDARDVSIFYTAKPAVNGVTLQIPSKSVTAIIGPSGCGKSTFLRCLNRMHELVPGARMTGTIRLYGEDLYAPTIDPTVVRRRVGMVFQKSNPFPTMSIGENVIVGLKLNGVRDKAFLRERMEKSLRMAALWDEVKNDLNRPGMSLSGGQQQRLCIARAIAVQPEVLLMDEPASALDPIATSKVEELINELKRDYTIVIVTHNMQQATRVADQTAFFLLWASSWNSRRRGICSTTRAKSRRKPTSPGGLVDTLMGYTRGLRQGGAVGVWWAPRASETPRQEDFAVRILALAMVTGALALPGAVRAGQFGLASWHDPSGGSRRTASAQRWVNTEMVAAHRTLPMGTKVRVVNLSNGHEAVVRITDRGPYGRGRIIDVSRCAAQQLGVAPVRHRARAVAVTTRACAHGHPERSVRRSPPWANAVNARGVTRGSAAEGPSTRSQLARSG